MKEKYLRYKKYLRSALAMGTCLMVIGVFALVSKLFIFGSILMVLGIGALVLAIYLKKNKTKIETESKIKCPVCGDPVDYSTETRYYIANNLVEEEEFSKQTVTYDKLKKVIHYYKCEKSNFCLTVIESYSYVYGKEKRLTDVVNMDFNYTGDY